MFSGLLSRPRRKINGGGWGKVEEKIKNTIENNNTTIYTPSISLSFRTLGGHLVEIFKNPILLW